MKKLVIVESPGKTKTIEGYLGKNYKVVASIGHLRQLSSEPGAVKFDNEFQFQWELEKKKFQNISPYIKEAKEILLATDIDREGEAIAWHLQELIRGVNPQVSIKRISFVEITEKAIQDSLKNMRDINTHLVNAYFTRIGLDYSIGFTISPILRRKILLTNQSAGRVQSPALKLIVNREFERIKFVKEEYFSIDGEFQLEDSIIQGTLIQWNNKKITGKIKSKAEADQMLQLPKEFHVSEIQRKKINVKPSAPLITSTLQKEAGSKLGFKVVHTMRVAQGLYEGINFNGTNKALITYMRTDSTNMSEEAIKQIREYVNTNCKEYLPTKPNVYKSKVKNAQEAHECIRPTDIKMVPYDIKSYLSDDQFRLYELVWKQAIMSQMKPAIREQVTFLLEEKGSIFKSNASRIDFLGFMYMHQLSEKNKKTKGTENFIPPLKEKMKLPLKKAEVLTHETKPPARFSESLLLVELEKYGIGRPSTHPGIIETLLKRNYVSMQEKTFVPSVTGQIVSTFLELFFTKYVEYGYTAKIEDLLDEIANGKGNYQHILKELLDDLHQVSAEVSDVAVVQLFNRMGDFLSEHWNKKCTTCGGLLKLRKKFDFFMTCINCNCLYKIESQQKTSIGDFQHVKTDKYSYLAFGDKKLYLPQKFREELNDEKIKFLFELPLNIRIKSDGKEALAAMSKYGFYVKTGDKYKNFKELDKFIEYINQQEITNKLSDEL